MVWWETNRFEIDEIEILCFGFGSPMVVPSHRCCLVTITHLFN